MKTTIELANACQILDGLGVVPSQVERLIALVRADEREALIRYFDGHWRSDWSDGQIIEALEARGNT